MKNSNENQLAARLLQSPRLCEIASRFGCDPVTSGEKAELVAMGLAYQTPRLDGRSGTDTILTPMGRLASRASR